MSDKNKIYYPIVEIFDSVQGEGSWMGIPATFIRFSGCNLKCEWCDTKHSWNQCQDIEIKEIISRINQKTVILTGGEPTLQKLDPLLKKIKERNSTIKIAIETNGTAIIPKGIDWVVVSPKSHSNFRILPNPNELKYVVDEKFSLEVIPLKYRYSIPIWLQPNAFDLEKSSKKAYKLVMENSFLRLGIQLHKFYNIA